MKAKILASSLALSAAGLISLIAHEGYSDKAIIPIPGDRPTIGFGSTFKEDGTAVRMGETTTPQKALSRTLNHIQKDETRLKQCVTAPLSQTEYDILVDFAYWRGSGGACRSDVVKHINAERYADACAAYLNLDSRRAAGKDCSIPGNKCRGVWLRAQQRNEKCIGAQ